MSVVHGTSNAFGFWGEVDSKIDFCEPHYGVTPYVAEFYNSLSSLIYVFMGTYGFVATMRMNCRWIYPILFATLTLIGIGSTIFHGTMRWWAELWDELPMLLFGFLILVCLQGTHPVTSGTVGTYFYIAVTLGIVSAAVFYVKYQFYEIFLHSFTAIIVVAVLLGFTMKTNSSQTHQLLFLALSEIILGKLVWSVEHQLCGFTHYVIPYLHVVWHICSSFAAYHFVLYAMALRFEFFGYSAVWSDSDQLSRKSQQFGKLRFQPFNAFAVYQKDPTSFVS
mmetsp:Transcript_24965/g.44386  ORF Transcript_24965/g.44386 Transcript_24965/m.44386 type:complete len:279 (-) Transcript_24965:303-1139(-)|eukprot:CAMPEP_0197527712 /NCGR_PEP_ID=MMETSP1318-20131121/22620_1 /TAXON_ID=552666 /ORGANISM="Partenskyella glossopodia, Strain RCC365" /LENGTH=278 /DNA_ID=CAMNT_0043082497 /DNA_START=199 /DNA_END=1035 /DNA_ORIENTATION=-